MKPMQWHYCYDLSWKGVITPASFAHPAKFARGLVDRIVDYLFERGYVHVGSPVGDPFGGVASGGIICAYRGLQWIGNELEPRFVGFAKDNIELHRRALTQMGRPIPIINQGDSRNFDTIVDAILSSPPYVSGGHHTDVMDAGNQNGRGQAGAIVTSPPYSGSLDDGGPEKQHPDGYVRTNNWTGYGKTEGQIATLKTGDVDKLIIIEDEAKQTPPEVYEAMDAIVSSPPYETIHAGGGGLNHLPARKPGQQSGRAKGPSQEVRPDQKSYGDSAGQIANTAKGSVDTIISSPPFTGARGGRGIILEGHNDASRPSSKTIGERTFQGKDGEREEGNIETLATGKVEAIVSSPPYADSVNSDSHGIDWSKCAPDYPGRVNHPDRNAKHAAAADGLRYGSEPGQIGALKAVVTSPPWEKNTEGGRAAGKFKGDAVLKSKRGKGASDAAVLAQAERDQLKTLGTSEGQIGQTSGETYWEAMAKVYAACYRSLKPGGVMALVVKDFVKDKKRMCLCDDTMKLLVWLGFIEVERIHAMLVKDEAHAGLFEKEVVIRKERKSFFRRLHEQGLEKDDPRRIDYEEVLIVQKPFIERPICHIVCEASRKDGVRCAEDECDIESGVR